jgi:hypothetical protein
MCGHSLTRFFRHYGRALVVWAMMPLAALNGRTLVGCGCTGHFEEICQCQSSTPDKACCQKGGSCCNGHRQKVCSCCARDKTSTGADSQPDRTSTAIRHVGARHCVALAVHEVIPVTIVPIVSSDDSQIATLDFNSADATFLPAFSGSEHFVQWDLRCPPNDIVVMLHRFII